jgi:hypothetical protein
MKLVENWKEAWTWFSVQAISLAFIWEALPQETKDSLFVLIPDVAEPHVTAILLVAGLFGRMVDQQKQAKNVDTE